MAKGHGWNGCALFTFQGIVLIPGKIKMLRKDVCLLGGRLCGELSQRL
jgi:hypothetical protein